MKRLKGKKECYQIIITRPAGVSVSDLKNYIKESVESWSGAFHPDDPRFVIGHQSVKVQRINTSVVKI